MAFQTLTVIQLTWMPRRSRAVSLTENTFYHHLVAQVVQSGVTIFLLTAQELREDT